MGGKLSQPKLDKKIEQGGNADFKFCTVSMQGWQRQMENSSICSINIDQNNKNGNSLFAVFDGVRGFQVSQFVKETFLSVLVNSQPYFEGNYEQALKQSFQKIDRLLRSQKGQKRLRQIRVQNDGVVQVGDQMISDSTGCMASVILLTKKKIYSAHIGNSKMYLMNEKKSVALFQSHDPDIFDQKMRIQGAGGQVVGGRVNGNINVSRAFGFHSFKQNLLESWDKQIVTCLPVIKSLERNITDQFLIIGCDGIWGAYQRQEVSLLNRVKQYLQQKCDKLDECLNQIVNSTISKTHEGQWDIANKNMTIIMLRFTQL